MTIPTSITRTISLSSNSSDNSTNHSYISVQYNPSINHHFKIDIGYLSTLFSNSNSILTTYRSNSHYTKKEYLPETKHFLMPDKFSLFYNRCSIMDISNKDNYLSISRIYCSHYQYASNPLKIVDIVGLCYFKAIVLNCKQSQLVIIVHYSSSNCSKSSLNFNSSISPFKLKSLIISSINTIESKIYFQLMIRKRKNNHSRSTKNRPKIN